MRGRRGLQPAQVAAEGGGQEVQADGRPLGPLRQCGAPRVADRPVDEPEVDLLAEPTRQHRDRGEEEHLYEESTRLAETRLAQNTFDNH